VLLVCAVAAAGVQAAALTAAAPKAVPALPPSSLGAKVVKATLKAHNAWRAKYGVPPLTWDRKLAAYAQQWASRQAATGNWIHRPHGRYGENIFWAGGTQPSPRAVVAAWGAEAADYDLATDTCAVGKVCGHFTQLVWKTTTAVGCGRASGRAPRGSTWKGSNVYWVCNYRPAGNVAGRTFRTG
jgi:pathogenesis-related protein 1